MRTIRKWRPFLPVQFCAEITELTRFRPWAVPCSWWFDSFAALSGSEQHTWHQAGTCPTRLCETRLWVFAGFMLSPWFSLVWNHPLIPAMPNSAGWDCCSDGCWYRRFRSLLVPIHSLIFQHCHQPFLCESSVFCCGSDPSSLHPGAGRCRGALPGTSGPVGGEGQLFAHSILVVAWS